MASSFSFGFSGDDIDIDAEDSGLTNESDTNGTASSTVQIARDRDDHGSLPAPAKPERHNMGEWLSLLPTQLSYNKFLLNASRDHQESNDEKSLTLARREVFDIRTQLMAEDSADEEDNGELIAGLEEGDLKPNFYEGGFKTWECALDLARLVVDKDDLGLVPSPDVDDEGPEDLHVIELGAGTAMPSLALFAQLLLCQSNSDSTKYKRQRRIHFTLTDYNASVLRLVTLPNFLLTWNHTISSQNPPTTTATADHHQITENKDTSEIQEDDLDITPELVENFQQDLKKRNITIDFISGAWSPEFVDLVFSSSSSSSSAASSDEAKYSTLILASETIYSPLSLGAFSETLSALLRRSTTVKSSKNRALVAAKKVYFGVGGGVDEFLSVLKGISGDGVDVRQKLDIKKEGVGRLVLEIFAS